MIVERYAEGTIDLQADGNYRASRAGMKKKKGLSEKGLETRRSTLESAREFLLGAAPADQRATEAVKVFAFNGMRDDEHDAGPVRHLRRGSVTTPRHRILHRRLFVNPGDELVTDADNTAKLIYDCVKVERRGFGRVVIDGVLDEELAAYIDGKFPTVPVVSA